MQTSDPERLPLDATRDEQHLQQLQRMAMVGTLAAGLGHDLRNLLMPVMLRLDVLAASRELPEDVRNDVAGIRLSIGRLQRLSSGLRLLASDPYDQRNEAQRLQLSAWWDDVAPLVVDALAPHTRLRAQIPADLPFVSIPPGVLAQVVMNLVMNSRRAMNDVHAPVMELVAALDGERQVSLEVRDNGIGMDAEARIRCFEPFYTTRPREYATGLGLSTGKSLLQRYGGDLTLGEPTDTGVSFRILLPTREAAARPARQRDNGAAPRTGADYSRVRVALKDPRQRTVALLMLNQRGLHPWSDASGDLPSTPPGTVICDGDAVDALLAELSATGLRSQTRVIAVGTPTRAEPDEGDADVSWVAPSRLGSLAELLD